jgi:hypothetical protein
MQKVFAIIALCFSLAVSTSCASKCKTKYPALINIKRIHVSNFGDNYGADLVQEKIRLRLANSNRFSVVNTPDNADAILTGIAGIDRNFGGAWDGSGGSMGTRFSAYVVLSLVETKTTETVWSYEDNCRHGSSVSSCIADATIDKLIQDKACANKTN